MTKKSQAIGNQELNEAGRLSSSKLKSFPLGSQVTKRPKTGGRSRLSMAQRLELAIQRSKIAELHDDTTLEPALAALYLGISEKKLEELRRPPKGSDESFTPRLPFLKIFDQGATGRNQPVLHKLGDLRAYQRMWRATDSFEAAANAGLAGWLVKKHPFYVAVIKGAGDVVLADGWDPYLPEPDELFLALLRRTVTVRWMSLANAVLENWRDQEAQRILAQIGWEHWRRVSNSMESALQRPRGTYSID
jgi:hypothetical protein